MSPTHTHGPTRSWHRLVERYTPDGALGRLLFAASVGTPAVVLLLFGLNFSLLPTGLTELLVGPLFVLAGVAGAFVSLLVLWPVYLSLIGNVDQTEAYGERSSPSRIPASSDTTRTRDSTDATPARDSTDATPGQASTGAPDELVAADPDEQVGILKRLYAEGELSHEEYERRLSALVGDDDRERLRE